MERMRRPALGRLATGVLAMALAAAVPLLGDHASAASSPSPALVAAEAAPAVQLVVISYDATVLVPNEKNNLPAQQARQAQLHTMAANGQIGSSLQALNDQWARDLASDPNRYAYAAKPVHAIRTSVTATCSGWFVTPTGYLVTAAHCVTKDSTISDGLLSAFRTTNKNIPYLQTQAPAYHGNSGGPVLDADGSVVGTLIAAAADPNTGQLVAGEQFVLPATVVDRELAGHGVHPEAGAVTTDYDAALRNYFKGYYTWAVAGFQRVLAAFPDHPYAAPVRPSRPAADSGGP